MPTQAEVEKLVSNLRALFEAASSSSAADFKIALENISFKEDSNFAAKCRDASGNNVMHFAILGKNKAVVEYLLQEFPFLKDDPKKDGTTPLMLAALKSPEIFKKLLDAGCAVSGKNEDDLTPLHLVASDNSLQEFLDPLVKKGAEADVCSQVMGTPFCAAILGSNFQMATRLLEIAKFDINAHALSPPPVVWLSACELEENPDAKELLYKLLEIPSLNIQATDHTGYNALHCAAESKNYELCQKLVSKGVSPNENCHNKFPFDFLPGDAPEEIKRLLEPIPATKSKSNPEAIPQSTTPPSEENNMPMTPDLENCKKFKAEGSIAFVNKRFKEAGSFFELAFSKCPPENLELCTFVCFDAARSFKELKDYEASRNWCSLAISKCAEETQGNCVPIALRAKCYRLISNVEESLENYMKAAQDIYEVYRLQQDPNCLVEFERLAKLAKTQHEESQKSSS